MPIARGIAGAIVLLLLTPTASQSQESTELTLAAAVAAAQAHNPAIAAALLAAESAAARTPQAGKWANPQLSIYQENFPGAVPGANQWIVSVTQRVRIGGQLGLSTELALANQNAVARDAQAVRWRIGLRVQREYVAGYGRQQQLAVFVDAAAATRSLLRHLEARLAEEDVSEYDVRRIRRAVEALDTRERALRSDARNVGIRLAALTGIEPPADGWSFAAPDGQPGGPPLLDEAGPGAHVARPDLGAGANDPAADGAIASRPDVAAAQERQRAAGLAERRARKQAVPDLLFTAGYSRLDLGFDGFVWSIGATLPLFDRNRDEAAALTLEQARRAREVDLLQTAARSQRQQALEGYRAATAALLQIDRSPQADLAPIARVAYEEGEMNVTELVDALRADLDARLRRLELEEQRAVQWFTWRWATGDGRQGGTQ